MWQRLILVLDASLEGSRWVRGWDGWDRLGRWQTESEADCRLWTAELVPLCTAAGKQRCCCHAAEQAPLVVVGPPPPLQLGCLPPPPTLWPARRLRYPPAASPAPLHPGCSLRPAPGPSQHPHPLPPGSLAGPPALSAAAAARPAPLPAAPASPLRRGYGRGCAAPARCFSRASAGGMEGRAGQVAGTCTQLAGRSVGHAVPLHLL